MKPATCRIVHWIALAAGIALLYDGSWGCVYSAEKNITPYTGIITADAVNVRSGPGVDFEILCQLETDDLVLVQDSTLDWLKITLPRIGKAYVSSQYLIPTSTLLGTINANNINIRAGEGTNFNVIGQLNKNDPVEIVAKDGDWYQIYPRKNCFAWVKNNYVKNSGPAKIFEDRENLQQEALRLVSEAEDLENKERLLPSADQNFAPILQKYQAIARDFPKSLAAVYAQQRMAALQPQSIKPQTAASARETAALSSPVGSPLAEGILSESGRFLNKPGTHKLTLKKKTTYFVKSNTINLNDYVYYSVQVWGTIDTSKKSDVPVIEVTHIKKLN